VGVWVAIGGSDDSEATMSELSEFEIAGMAKSVKKSALIAAISPQFRAFTFAPFGRFDHSATSGLDSRPAQISLGLVCCVQSEV